MYSTFCFESTEVWGSYNLGVSKRPNYLFTSSFFSDCCHYTLLAYIAMTEVEKLPSTVSAATDDDEPDEW